jgi:hypothetical protein
VWSKTHVGDLKDGLVIIPFAYCREDNTCLHTLDLEVNEPIQQGLSPTIHALSEHIYSKACLLFSYLWN